MSRSALLALLLLGACARSGADVVLATLPSAQVVSVDRRLPRTCTLKDQSVGRWLSCLTTRPDRQQCVRLELRDAPGVDDSPATRCQPREGVLVLQTVASRAATLRFDELAGRYLYTLDGSCGVVLLDDGRLMPADPVTCPAPGAAFDPASLPTRLAHLERRHFVIDAASLDALIAASPDPGAELEASLKNVEYVQTEGWALAYSRLPPERREAVREQLVTDVSEGETRALDWFDAHPEEKNAAWTEALLSLVVSGERVPSVRLLEELEQRAPGRLAERACQALGEAWAEGAFDDEQLDLERRALPLWLLSRRRSTCPWVDALFERARCSTWLSCAAELELPRLCTDAEHQALLASAGARLLRDPSPPEEDAAEQDEATQTLPGELSGALLLELRRREGALPADFARRYARMSYEGAEGALDESYPPLRRLLCEMPLTATRLESSSVVIEVDDARRELVVASPE